MTDWNCDIRIGAMAPHEVSPGILGEILDVDVKLLYKLSNQTPLFYRIYKIPKKSGGFRTIEAPEPVMKLVQQRILRNILNRLPPSGIAAAFRHGSGIKGNAEFHVGQKVILKIDLKNFFPSLKSPLVFSLFEESGFAGETATLLTKLCTLYGHLPQGAPTSPYLSNLLMRGMDEELLARFAGEGINITRYADDITFSGDLGNGRIVDIIRFCRAAAGQRGLKLNRRKICICRAGHRQEVTGLVVNEAVHVPREMKRKLRQSMYFLNKHWEREWRQLDSHTLDCLLGSANFVCDIEPANAEYGEYRRQLLEIKKYDHRHGLAANRKK